MWKLVYDSWNEQWLVSEFSRSDLEDCTDLYVFRVEALDEASKRNNYRELGGAPFWYEGDDTL